MNADALIILIYVLVLASYLGFELIAKVPPTLHTPLMSGSNAISGITIVGAILASFHCCSRYGLNGSSQVTIGNRYRIDGVTTGNPDSRVSRTRNRRQHGVRA